MEDRRNIKRWSLLLFLPVYERPSGAMLGHIADITTGGLMLFSQDILDLGKEFSIEIRVNDLKEALLHQAGDPENDIHLAARSRWVAPNPGLNRTGLMFTDVSDEAQLAINRVVEHVKRNFDSI